MLTFPFMRPLFLSLILVLLSALLHAGTRIHPGIALPNDDAATVRSWCMELYSGLAGESLTLDLVYKKRSAAATYFTFAVKRSGVLLEPATVKAAVDKQNRLVSVVYEVPAVWPQHEPDAAELQALQQLPVWEAARTETVWYFTGGQWRMALKEEAFNLTFDRTRYRASDGSVLADFDHRRYVKIDTLVSARVFNPDPLTTLNQVYGAPYLDLADSNQPWMASAYLSRNVPMVFDTNDQLFKPENRWVRITDLEAPAIAPLTSSTPFLLFNRKESGFEEVNILYHVSAFQQHIASLGYDTLLDLQLDVDAHGQFGGDNSYFQRNGGNPFASFGTGGVDDAEDADVIIHEYCHGISWSANGNGNFTAPRSGLDEGLADYFATSWSRAISPFGWERVFSWDGHNEYWSGRIANSTATWPSGGNIYAVGEIWNSAMSDIWGSVGQVVADKLMLEALHFFTDSTNLPEAAAYVMKADTLLFGGQFAWPLCVHFSSRGLMPPFACAPSGVGAPSVQDDWMPAGTMAFAQGQGPLYWQAVSPQGGQWRLLTASGALLRRGLATIGERVQIEPTGIAPGVYVLEWREGERTVRTKVARW